jgi:hypothetical protein
LVDRTSGALVVAGFGVAALIVVFAFRRRLPRPAVDVLIAACGAGLGFGALKFQADVSDVAWILTPLVGAAAAVWHVRALFGGAGPLRT